MAYSRKYIINEVGYQIERGARYVGLKLGGVFLKGMTAVGSIMAGVAGSGTGLAISGTIGMSAGIGMQAYLNHKDYKRKLNQLRELYEKEIGAKLGKDYRYVSIQDLEQVAETNPTLHKQIELEKKRRDVDTGVAAAIGLVSLAAVGAVFAATLSTFAVIPVGLAMPFIAKPIIKPLAERIFNVDEKTPIDLIKGLEGSRTRFQSVSKSQVMEVFVASSPKLQEAIEKKYNKPFAKLELSDKDKIMNQYGEMIKLEETTRSINDYSMNPRELTFIIHGTRSGVEADKSYKDAFNSSVSKIQSNAQNIRKNIDQTIAKTKHRVNHLVSGTAADNAHDTSEAPGTSHSEDNFWQKKENMRRSQPPNMQQQRG